MTTNEMTDESLGRPEGFIEFFLDCVIFAAKMGFDPDYIWNIHSPDKWLLDAFAANTAPGNATLRRFAAPH